MVEGHACIRTSLAELEDLSYNPGLVSKLYATQIITKPQLDKIRAAAIDSEKNLELWLILEQKCKASADSFDKILKCLKDSECPDAVHILNNCRSLPRQVTPAVASNSNTPAVASNSNTPARNQQTPHPAANQTGNEEETWQDKFNRENNIKVEDKTLWSKCQEISKNTSKNKNFEYKNKNTQMAVNYEAGSITLKNVKDFQLGSLFQYISSAKEMKLKEVKHPSFLEYVTKEDVKKEMFKQFLSNCSMLDTLIIELPIDNSISIPLKTLESLTKFRATNAILTAHTSQDVCLKLKNLVLLINCKLKGSNVETEFPKLFPQLTFLQIENHKRNNRAEIIDSGFLNGAIFKKIL